IPIDIHITLPVRYPEVWKSPEIQENLSHLLQWYTEDNWHFTFTKAVLNKNSIESSKLPLSGQREVALWSAGLDSFTGLIQRIKSKTAEEYLVFGTGSNDFIHAKQKKLVQGEHGLRESFGGRIGYQRLHISFNGATSIPHNQEFRARGLAFVLL